MVRERRKRVGVGAVPCAVGAWFVVVAAASRADAQCSVAVPAQIVGRRTMAAVPVVFTPAGAQAALAWVVPARRDDDASLRVDDAAAVVLGPNVDVRVTLDRENPAPSNDVQFDHLINRATAVARGDGFAVLEDREDGSEPYTSTVRCGAHESVTATVRTRGADRSFEQVLYDDATYACRVVAASQPFVLGARGRVDAQRRFANVIELVAGSETATTLAPTGLTLAVPASAAQRSMSSTVGARNPIEGMQAVRAGDYGWFLVLRYRHELYGAWLDPALHARTPLVTFGGPAADQGLAALAWNGREVLVVHATRAARSQPFSLVAERVAPGAAPGAPQPLASRALRAQHAFSPSVAALPSGWVVGYSVGTLEGGLRGGAQQHVWVAAYDPALAPRGDAVRVSDDAGGSDLRLVVAGASRVLSAYAGGQGDVRDVRAAALECR